MVTEQEIFKRMLSGEPILADLTDSWDDADVLEACGVWKTYPRKSYHYTWVAKYPLRIIMGEEFYELKVGDTFWMDMG